MSFDWRTRESEWWRRQRSRTHTFIVFQMLLRRTFNIFRCIVCVAWMMIFVWNMNILYCEFGVYRYRPVVVPVRHRALNWRTAKVRHSISKLKMCKIKTFILMMNIICCFVLILFLLFFFMTNNEYKNNCYIVYYIWSCLRSIKRDTGRICYYIFMQMPKHFRFNAVVCVRREIDEKKKTKKKRFVRSTSFE